MVSSCHTKALITDQNSINYLFHVEVAVSKSFKYLLEKRGNLTACDRAAGVDMGWCPSWQVVGLERISKAVSKIRDKWTSDSSLQQGRTDDKQWERGAWGGERWEGHGKSVAAITKAPGCWASWIEQEMGFAGTDVLRGDEYIIGKWG